jgi:chromosome segregation ATPase
MSQEVKQWLTEIKLLQEKVVAAQQERDEAYASAVNWRNLYETEAKQRRAEAKLAQQAIDSLKHKLQLLQMLPQSSEPEVDLLATIQAEVEPLQNPDELQGFLVRALAECDRLTRSLKAEQAAHAQTRKDLTSALGDTMKLLAKERERAQTNLQPTEASASKPKQQTVPSAQRSEVPLNVKAPLLELPQFD